MQAGRFSTPGSLNFQLLQLSLSESRLSRIFFSKLTNNSISKHLPKTTINNLEFPAGLLWRGSSVVGTHTAFLAAASILDCGEGPLLPFWVVCFFRGSLVILVLWFEFYGSYPEEKKACWDLLCSLRFWNAGNGLLEGVKKSIQKKSEGWNIDLFLGTRVPYFLLLLLVFVHFKKLFGGLLSTNYFILLGTKPSKPNSCRGIRPRLKIPPARRPSFAASSHLWPSWRCKNALEEAKSCAKSVHLLTFSQNDQSLQEIVTSETMIPWWRNGEENQQTAEQTAEQTADFGFTFMRGRVGRRSVPSVSVPGPALWAETAFGKHKKYIFDKGKDVSEHAEKSVQQE